MSNAATIFAVDSPRTHATLKKHLLARRADLYASLRDVASWELHIKVVGGLDEIDIILGIIEEMEDQERR